MGPYTGTSSHAVSGPPASQDSGIPRRGSAGRTGDDGVYSGGSHGRGAGKESRGQAGVDGSNGWTLGRFTDWVNREPRSI